MSKMIAMEATLTEIRILLVSAVWQMVINGVDDWLDKKCPEEVRQKQ